MESACATHQPYSDVQHVNFFIVFFEGIIKEILEIYRIVFNIFISKNLQIELNDESRINNQFEENISFDLIQNGIFLFFLFQYMKLI